MQGEGQKSSHMMKNVFSGHHFSSIFARAPSPSGLASVLSFPHPCLWSLLLFFPWAGPALPGRRLGSKGLSYPCLGSTLTQLPSLLSTLRSWSQEYRFLISSPNSSASCNTLAWGTSAPSPCPFPAHLKAPPAPLVLLPLFFLCPTLSCTSMVLLFLAVSLLPSEFISLYTIHYFLSFFTVTLPTSPR